MKWLAAAGCAVVSMASAVGQDTRKVSEPVVPAVCVKLEARLLWSRDGRIMEGGGKSGEEMLDTERIQKAIDGCSAGKAVELTNHVGAIAGLAGNAYLTGPLNLREGVTLLIGEGVTLYGSRDPAVYEMAKGDEAKLCGTSMPRPKDLPVFSMNAAAKPKGGCRALINVNGAKNTAVMGLGGGASMGTIDGRGYAKLVGHDYSWWEMARKAQPADDLYYSTKLITANKADGFVLYNLRLVNAPNYHVTVGGTDGFTAWGVHLQTPVDKRMDTRNTDGIDPGTSQNITIAHSWIDNGDDNIAVKQGISHMSVLDNHFYSGHGMSIGSETVLGQSFLLVDGLTEDHTTSGIRIKSNVKRGGPVHDLTYRNICMRDVAIPIAISPYYTNQTVEPFEDPKYEGDKIPDYKGIVLENIYAETPGDVLIAGLNDDHRTEVTLRNVTIKGIARAQLHLNYVDLIVPVPWTNLPLGVGVNKTVKVVMGAGNVTMPTGGLPDPCTGKFVPMQ